MRETEADDPHVLHLLDLYAAELALRVPAYQRPSAEELRAERGTTFVLHEGDAAVGCGSLRLLAPDTAEVKRMFVVASCRGRGYARRILSALEGEALALGCTRVVLDTAAPLHEAAAMYLREGYVEIAPYNDNPVAARWFAKTLARTPA